MNSYNNNTRFFKPFHIYRKKKSYTSVYQNVLNYAIDNGITIPDDNQNVINDNIIENLISIGAWSDFDVFYYFKQPAGLADFAKINWVDPNKHLITEGGAANASYVSNKGFKADGNSNQALNTNFNVLNDSVNLTDSNLSFIYNLFDVSNVWEQTRYFGSFSSGSGLILVASLDDSRTFMRLLNTNHDPLNYNQNFINGHYHVCIDGTESHRHMNGVQIKSDLSVTTGTLPNQDMYLLSNMYDGAVNESEGVCGLSYWACGAKLNDKQHLIYRILNLDYTPSITILPNASNGVLKLTLADVTTSSFYYVRLYKSSDFPSITTTKNYMVLWSTDHDNGSGGVYWGECDDFSLAGFQENGKIIDGYQSETPCLLLSPNDPDGDIIHLYYHVDSTHPDADDDAQTGNYQQTRLLTTTGGLLHAATWTDRGKPLGMVDAPVTEDHTGYLLIYKQNDGTFKGIHACKRWTSNDLAGIPKIGRSNSVNGRSWTRETSNIDATSFMPENRQCHQSPSLYFNRNGKQYCAAGNITFDFDFANTNAICIYEANGNYEPIELLGQISNHNSGNGASNYSFEVDGDTLHIYYVMDKIEVYHATWDLTELD